MCLCFKMYPPSPERSVCSDNDSGTDEFTRSKLLLYRGEVTRSHVVNFVQNSACSPSRSCFSEVSEEEWELESQNSEKSWMAPNGDRLLLIPADQQVPEDIPYENVSHYYGVVETSSESTTNENGEELETLPFSISNFCHLTYLRLFSSGLSELPTSLRGLSLLEILDLSENVLLNCLPEWLGDFLNLEELNISKTKISDLPNTAGKLRKLHTVDVSDTPICNDKSKLSVLYPCTQIWEKKSSKPAKIFNKCKDQLKRFNTLYSAADTNARAKVVVCGGPPTARREFYSKLSTMSLWFTDDLKHHNIRWGVSKTSTDPLWIEVGSLSMFRPVRDYLLGHQSDCTFVLLLDLAENPQCFDGSPGDLCSRVNNECVAAWRRRVLEAWCFEISAYQKFTGASPPVVFVVGVCSQALKSNPKLRVQKEVQHMLNEMHQICHVRTGSDHFFWDSDLSAIREKVSTSSTEPVPQYSSACVNIIPPVSSSTIVMKFSAFADLCRKTFFANEVSLPDDQISRIISMLHYEGRVFWLRRRMPKYILFRPEEFFNTFLDRVFPGSSGGRQLSVMVPDETIKEAWKSSTGFVATDDEMQFLRSLCCDLCQQQPALTISRKSNLKASDYDPFVAVAGRRLRFIDGVMGTSQFILDFQVHWKVRLDPEGLLCWYDGCLLRRGDYRIFVIQRFPSWLDVVVKHRDGRAYTVELVQNLFDEVKDEVEKCLSAKLIDIKVQVEALSTSEIRRYMPNQWRGIDIQKLGVLRDRLERFGHSRLLTSEANVFTTISSQMSTSGTWEEDIDCILLKRKLMCNEVYNTEKDVEIRPLKTIDWSVISNMQASVLIVSSDGTVERADAESKCHLLQIDGSYDGILVLEHPEMALLDIEPFVDVHWIARESTQGDHTRDSVWFFRGDYERRVDMESIFSDFDEERALLRFPIAPCLKPPAQDVPREHLFGSAEISERWKEETPDGQWISFKVGIRVKRKHEKGGYIPINLDPISIRWGQHRVHRVFQKIEDVKREMPWIATGAVVLRYAVKLSSGI